MPYTLLASRALGSSMARISFTSFRVMSRFFSRSFSSSRDSLAYLSASSSETSSVP